MIEVVIAVIVLAAAGTFGAAWFIGRQDQQQTAPTRPKDVPDATLPKSIAPATGKKHARTAAESDDEGDSKGTEEKYCNEIRTSIHRNYHTLEDVTEETAELLCSLTQALPKLPNATLDLIPILAKPGTGAKEVAHVIERDQASAARLLRWVNSSFYGLEGKVKSLQRAVTILGIDTVRSVVLEDAFSRGVRFRGLQGLSPHTIWRHAAATSIAAKHLARNARGVEPDVAATAGLLHDIGLLLLLILERQNLKGILEVSREFKESVIENEFDFLGFNHQVWGESFVKSWNLPDQIASAIGRHHCPMREPFDPLAAVLWLANYLVARMGFACPQDQIPVVPDEELAELMKRLGLRPPLAYHISEGLIREMVSATSCWTPSEVKPQEAVNQVEAELGNAELTR